MRRVQERGCRESLGRHNTPLDFSGTRNIPLHFRSFSPPSDYPLLWHWGGGEVSYRPSMPWTDAPLVPHIYPPALETAAACTCALLMFMNGAWRLQRGQRCGRGQAAPHVCCLRQPLEDLRARIEADGGVIMFLCASRLPSCAPGDRPSRASTSQVTAGRSCPLPLAQLRATRRFDFGT